MLKKLIFSPFHLWCHRELFTNMLKRNITQRYKGSILGYLWSFVQPLLMLCVYSFVFGIIFKARWGVEGLDNHRAAFPLIMFCGMAVYNLFSESVNSSCTVILGHANLVKKVVFPLQMLPLVVVGTAVFYNLAWFLLLFVGAVIWLDSLSWTMLLLPLTLLPLTLISAGVSLAVASFGVYLRDTPQFVALIMQVLFFMTPIFYPLSMVPEKFAWVLQLNPLTPVVEQTRVLFLYRQQPDYVLCSGLLCFSIAIFYLGYAAFMQLKKGFSDIM